MQDLFLVEKGKYVVIVEDGKEISFSSFAEYEEFSGVDLTGKNYVCYDPTNGFEIDDSKPDRKMDSAFKVAVKAQKKKADTEIKAGRKTIIEDHKR